ncbi:addiction module killer protein (plasmid) [Rhizobium gallicum]|uniref:Addiction module killer protein n=2 Tax=Rhizobium TaxID=379 RepID=A0A1L5NUM9_9HYPH|nr:MULTISPECIES: type II toxin-antitoxin system RelE/ParE family toxin [Rhizobium]APO71559.1 addiction module killer protein [Rhizobium gallicum]TCU33515.1 putative addiction module killer protein [Rhizobium azibense]
MIEVRLTVTFSRWLEDLKDRRARDRVLARLRRFELENFGDAKPVGSGVSEARIDYGPGYRLYFVRQADVVVVMLCCGDKASQKRDIATAKAMAKEL